MPRDSRTLSTAGVALGILLGATALTACADTQQASAEPRAEAEGAGAADRPDADSVEIARLLTQLGDPDLAKAEAARDRLHAIGPVAMPALTAGLGHDDPQVVWLAAEAMKGFGDAVSPAVPALLSALTHLRGRQEAERVREALGEVGPGAAPHVPALLAYAEQLVNDSTQKKPWFVHSGDIHAVVAALGGIGPGARDAVPFLLGAWEVHRRTPGGDRFTLRALGATQDPRALAALDSALRATSPSATVSRHDTQNTVAEALALAGEPGAVLLDQAYTADNIPVRLAVVYGYAALGEAGVARLGRVLEDVRPCQVAGVPEMHRALALQALRERESLPSSLVPALRGIVRDSKHHEAPRIARELIARIGA